jgi:hypothetical protein
MAKTKISEWSATPSNNTDIDGINIAEGCAPSGINNAIRELMSQVKDLYAGTTGDATAVGGGGTGATTASAARTNLGVAIGTDVQAYDAELSTLAGMSSSRATFLASTEGFGFRNRIINGDMRIDQRNAGASVTPTTDDTFTLDRWSAGLTQASKFSVQRSTVVPAGFSNSLLATSLASTSLGAGDAFLLSQNIEGFNVADFGWGSTGAQSVTLSFWVRSSLTGTFGGVVANSAANRSYPFTYTVSAANTWEQKTVTIAGDTTGTWLTNNGTGMRVRFSLGAGSNFSGTAGAWAGSTLFSATGATSVVGTNGATFYITGVQLEAGSVASPFERRDYGRELMMCQRYYYRVTNNATAYTTFAIGRAYSSTEGNATVYMPVPMRASPTIGKSAFGGTNWDYSISAINIVQVASDFRLITVYSAGSFTNGGAYALAAGNTTSTIFLDFSAEL